MPKRRALILATVMFAASGVLSNPHRVWAQATTPGLPGTPQPTPNYSAGQRVPFGVQGGSGNYTASAAANEHSAFVWVVDNIQHAVVLCEKTDGGKDFTCTKKPLP